MEKIKKWENGDHRGMLSVFFLRALRYTKKLSFFKASCLARVCGKRILMGGEASRHFWDPLKTCLNAGMLPFFDDETPGAFLWETP
ncbi:MAG: hypothetical protein K6E31_02000 [bacterium]|nr:hypothetical protein [bacterium]